MSSKDISLTSLWVVCILGLTAPAWLLSNRVLFNYGDLFTYHYPLRQLVASSLQAGALPFWNPYILCGVPLAANPQAVLFYPVAILGSLIPMTLALTWDMLFHFFWAGLGIHLLARREGLPAWAASVLAALYVFCPFLVYRVTQGIPTLLASLAWAPWCWLALLSRNAWLLAAAWALQFLSGHPQFFLINGCSMGLWMLLNGYSARLWKCSLAASLSTAVLIAIQLAPSWEFLYHSNRIGWSAIRTSAYFLHRRDLISLIWPGAGGFPTDGIFFGIPSVFFETRGLWLGFGGLCLAVFGLLASRSWARVILILIGVLASLNCGPIVSVFAHIHLLNILRTPARWLFVSLWGLLLLIGAGLKHLSVRRLNTLVVVCLCATILMELLIWNRKFLRAVSVGSTLSVNPTLAAAIGYKPWRVLTDPALANPNKTMLYRAMNVNGYEAFYLRDFILFAAASGGKGALDFSWSYLAQADVPRMQAAGVAGTIDASGRAHLRSGAQLASFVPSSINSHLKVVIKRPERWTIRGQAAALTRGLFVAQPFYPGWRVEVDGQPGTLQKDGFFSYVPVAAQTRERWFEAHLIYKPSLWQLWSALTVAAWIFWLGWGARRLIEITA